LSPLLSVISTELGAPIAHISRAVAAYGAGSAISAIWLGRSLDGFGMNRALFWSMTVAGLSQFLSAFSQDWITLSALQMLAGAAAGIALPSIYGLTTTVAPKGQEAQTLSRVTFGWSISLVAAVPLAAYFTDFMGWRLTLSSLGALHLIMLIPLRLYKGPPTPAATKFSLLMPFTLKGSIPIYTINFIFMAGFYGIYAFSGTHAVNGFGQSTTLAGLLALVYGAGFGTASFFAKYLDRASPNMTLPIGLLAATAIICAIAYAPSYQTFLIAFALWGFLNHLNLTLIITRITDLTATHKGAVLSMYSGITYIASMVSILLYGSLFESHGFTYIVMLAASFQICACIIAIFCKKSTKT
jgi:predicted MFS family arabinose efflux permease